MFSEKITGWRMVGLMVALTSVLGAADFTMPAEGPVAFRRDRIPLDTDTISSLSRQLTTLAGALDAESAAQRRGAAQMLALALTLDPGNGQARELLGNYHKGIHRPDEDSEKIGKDRVRLWQYIQWLETPEAGTEGLALAACLKDVMNVSDPNDPRADALRKAGEQGAWEGWIPPLSAYELPVTGSEAATRLTDPDILQPATAVPALVNAQISMPLWQPDATLEPVKWVPMMASIRMTAEKTSPSSEGEMVPYSLVIGSSGNAEAFAQVGRRVMKILTQESVKLPEGVRVTISGKLLDASVESKKPTSISAVAAVLASASITGREPTATIIGEIDETGTFVLPKNFWEQLRILEAGEGGRLVMPAAAADYLPALLALEKPEFFLKYEVVLAADFKELIDFTAKSPPERLAAAFTGFEEIRDKVTSQTLRQQVSNSAVRRRLAEIAQELPGHWSARMLAIQGSGNRPTQITRTVMICEIRRALEPIAWLAKTLPQEFSGTQFSKISTSYESSRLALDSLERYVEKDDREILERAGDLASAVRTLDRASRARSGEYDSITPFMQAHATLLRLHKQFTTDIALAAGEEAALPPP
jgi:hypothetical protein